MQTHLGIFYDREGLYYRMWLQMVKRAFDIVYTFFVWIFRLGAYTFSNYCFQLNLPIGFWIEERYKNG